MGRAWENPGPQIAPNASATGREILPWVLRRWDLTSPCPLRSLPRLASLAPHSSRGPVIPPGEGTVFVEPLLSDGESLGVWQGRRA